MNAPLPREIRKVLDRQRRQLERMVPAQRRRLVAIAKGVKKRLEDRLQVLTPGSFGAQSTRVLLAQVRQVVDVAGAEYGRELGDAIAQLGQQSALIARDRLLDEIEAWGSAFRGSVRGTARVELAGDVLDEGLLEYYRVSRERYGLEAIRKMRDVMAEAILSGETVPETTLRLARALELEPWRAERIVRTEQSVAVHRRQLEDMKAMLGPDADEWRKMLVATLDSRTGDDSRYVNGQQRRLGEPFEDNEGRVYQHPPNRPNDRETVVFVPARRKTTRPPESAPKRHLRW